MYGGVTEEGRTILQFLLMPVVAALWWLLFGEDQAEYEAERQMTRDLDPWALFWGLALLYALLLLVITHGCRVNPLHA